MADVHTKEQRSYNMSQIKATNTKPEEMVRKYLFSRGFRYRKNDKRLPGKPDIVLPKYKTVVFVNGCFWHGHSGCRYFVWPKSNTEFWKEKITRNVNRDKEVRSKLEESGWTVLTVWECELKKESFEKTMLTIEKQIQANNDTVNRTLEYYDRRPETYSIDTLNLKFSGIQDLFLKYLQPGSLILDFGCGSGRDTKYFLRKGFKVEPVDGSEAMTKIASINTGLPVKKMLFNELDETRRYDGIFACASILHVPYKELPVIFRKMKKALKDDGVIYVSFKYGNFEGYRGDRYYTDLDESRLNELLAKTGGLAVKEVTITLSVMKDRDEKWLNAIIKKEIN